MADNANSTKVITGKVRFSYANVFTPRAAEEGGQEKFSVSVLIDKDDKETLGKIEKAIKAALEEGKEKKFGGKIPKAYKNPLRDGEEYDDEAYEGMMFVNANNTRKPQIVDANTDPILDQDEFYSGCYGRASLNFYAFNSNGNKGVACSLGNLQKLEDGEPLSASFSSAEDDFGGENAYDVDDLI